MNIDKKVKKAPWKPWVSGVYGVLFGPTAAGLVAYINLKRMGHDSKALRVFGLSILYAVSALIIFSLIPIEKADMYGKLFQALIGALFPFYQNKEFKAWQDENKLANYPSNGWSAFGWAIFGLLLLVILVGIISVILSYFA